MSGPYTAASDIPQVIPLFPLDRALLLPHASRPLNIFEPRYLNMVDDAMASERIIGMVQTAPGGTRERPHLSHIGCAGRITAFAETADGRYLITLTGLARFRLGEELPASTPYRRARVDFQPYEEDLRALSQDNGERTSLLDALRRYLDHRSMRIDWQAVEAAPVEPLVNSLAMAMPFDSAEQQALLEAPSVAERRNTLITLLEIDGAMRDDEAPPSLQ